MRDNCKMNLEVSVIDVMKMTPIAYIFSYPKATTYQVSSSIPGHNLTYMYTHFIHENQTFENDILQKNIVLYSMFNKSIILFSQVNRGTHKTILKSMQHDRE